MSPFIKFTTETRGAAKTTTSFVYVNVAHVVQATYSQDPSRLTILVAAPGGKLQSEPYTLQGEEAEAALKVLQDLP